MIQIKSIDTLHLEWCSLLSERNIGSYLFRSYLSTISSRWSCEWTRFGSHSPSHVLAHSSLPCALINSISSAVNVAIEIDFTRCGGVKPRLEFEINTLRDKIWLYCIVNPTIPFDYNSFMVTRNINICRDENVFASFTLKVRSESNDKVNGFRFKSVICTTSQKYLFSGSGIGFRLAACNNFI